jgi:hypothetical protein
MWFMDVGRFIVLIVIAAAAVYVAGVLLKSEGRQVASTAPTGGKTAEGFEVSGGKGDGGEDKRAESENEDDEENGENNTDDFVDAGADGGGVSDIRYTPPTKRAKEGGRGGGEPPNTDRRDGADAGLVEYMKGLEDRLSRLADGLDDALEALQLRRRTLEAGIVVSLGSRRDDYTVEKLETVPPMSNVEAFSPFMGAY